MLSRLFGKRTRMAIGWTLFIGCVPGWAASEWFTDEPHFILALSWAALWLEGWNALQIADQAG